MGGEGGDFEGSVGVSPSGVQTDHEDDGETCGRRRVGISPGGGSTISIRLTPLIGLHLETSGNHSVMGYMPTHLWNLYQGRVEARDDPDDDMVVSGRGK